MSESFQSLQARGSFSRTLFCVFAFEAIVLFLCIFLDPHGFKYNLLSQIINHILTFLYLRSFSSF